METFYQGKLLREGVTTGSCAAAAAKAAVLALLSGACPEKAVVTTAAGPREIAVHTGRADGAGYLCSVIKDAGDDPDVTDGLEICARVELTAEEGVVIDGGEGVGRVTRKGLKTPVGSAAINPVPLQMIESEVRSVLPQGGACALSSRSRAVPRLPQRPSTRGLGLWAVSPSWGPAGLSDR